MLLRAAQVARILLLVTGVALAIWLPLSFWLVAELISTQPASGSGLFSSDGAIEVWVHDGPFAAPADETRFSIHPDRYHRGSPGRRFTFAMWPHIEHSSGLIVSIPVWILAALVLVWPTASYILDRRRSVRGFAIQPAAATTDTGG